MDFIKTWHWKDGVVGKQITCTGHDNNIFTICGVCRNIRWGAVNGGMMDKAANLIPVVEKMLPKLDSILTSVNALLADPALAASLHNVETITSNLTVSTRELNTLMAGLNKQVPGRVRKANGVLDNTNRLTANLASLDVQGTLNKVNQTLESAHQFTEKLNNNQGSLGLLMMEREFQKI